MRLTQKILAAMGFVLTSGACWAAEAWTCTFPGLISPVAVRERFEVRSNEVIRDGQMAYRIVENNSRALTATYSRTQPADFPVTAGTLALEKLTGKFAISVMVPGAPLASKVVNGTCDKSD